MSPAKPSRPYLASMPLLLIALTACPAADDGLRDPREVHLRDVRQLTFGGENAEAYWSSDGRHLIYQATVEPYACDQIFLLDPEKPGERRLVSTGSGRTTCAYFLAGDDRVIYATTHLIDEACPPPPDRSQGYVWPIYPSYEIVSVRPDGSDLKRLTDNDAYDAEATVCPVDGTIVFTSTRDGDLDLYRMDADGSNVERLTETPGYDGGAFFNRDCSRIVWRASRPEGEELEDYRRLLAQGLVRPGKLELFVANADGSEPRQVTYLGAAAFAPYFHPSGERILFSTNYGDPAGREFDVWAIDADGTDLERITYAPGFDGFPMFSPSGERLAFASNRNQGKPGETDIYVARWLEESDPAAFVRGPADRFYDDVAWLADDAREGRGVGTAGLAEAGDWLVERFVELGLEPAFAGGSYRQPFPVPVAVAAGPATAVAIDGRALAGDDFRPASFSSSGTAEAEVVAVGYGISAPELGHDDYAHRQVEGKIVAVRRFVPSAGAFDNDDAKRRYGDLRYKAWAAREHGAAGVVIVDLPAVAAGESMPEESPLPALAVDAEGDAGLPVVIARRAAAAELFDGGPHRARLEVELEVTTAEVWNVGGKLPAAGGAHGGPIVVGAHYDHLGFGGRGSLEPDSHAPHNGADDNASGTAALLEIARQLAAARDELRRDVYLVAFSAEESGLLGSTFFTKNPPPGLEVGEVMAMINLDMVGRLRDNVVSVLGAGSAGEWQELVPASCDRTGLGCKLGGDGYGPSDQTPFYAAGVPVLHFFTGTHLDYHKPSDDVERINAAGGARIALLVADLVRSLSARRDPLTYVAAQAPAPQGDQRSYGASLGTIPDYADDRGGVLLAGVRPGSAADRAGLRRGDRLVELAGHPVGDIYDFMYVLRQSKPGQTVTAVVERDGRRLELEVTFGSSSRLR
ncbi:MAG: M28 family peptidase [Acidobacteria bacterium]|nr:MAG: M28 family peptidase [Acidobacteriota bacterium]